LQDMKTKKDSKESIYY